MTVLKMDLMHLAVIAMLFSGLWAVKVLYLSLFLEGRWRLLTDEKSWQ